MSKIIICDDAELIRINRIRLVNRQASLELELNSILNQLKTI